MGCPLLPRRTGGLLVPRPWKKRRQKKEREREGKANREGRKGPGGPARREPEKAVWEATCFGWKPVRKVGGGQSRALGAGATLEQRGCGGRTGAGGRAGGQRLGTICPWGPANEQMQSGRRWVPTAYLKPQLGHVSHQPVPTGFLLRLQGKTRAKLGTESWGHSPFPSDQELSQIIREELPRRRQEGIM